MLVTLFSDASLCPDTRCGGWAAWVKCDRGTCRGEGPFRFQTIDTSIAEAMAVINGLYIAIRDEIIRTDDIVLVQTDSNSVMGILRGETRRRVTEQIRMRRRTTYRALRKDVQERNELIDMISGMFLKFMEDHKIKVVWRHVKGHKGLEDRRSAVNTDCDARARQGMLSARRAHRVHAPAMATAA